jgi:hypothetical protein
MTAKDTVIQDADAITPHPLLVRYGDDIAFVTEETRATTLTDFATQLGTAADRLADAGINGAEDLESAATYLADAANATGGDRAVLLKRASSLLNGVTDMVDEYRLMV